MQVNQGENEYYKIRTSALLPRRALRDHNILISLSVFQVNQGSSFWETFAYNSKYDCTLLLVPFFDHGLLQFPSAFHISKRQRYFSPFDCYRASLLCFTHMSSFVEVTSFCTVLFVLPKAPLISTAVSSKVWEGLRCRLSQGWQLGAVLTYSLIKSSWARVHMWHWLCQAADRWEAVLNTKWRQASDALPPPCCANNSCNSILKIWYDTRRRKVRAACLPLPISSRLGVHELPCGLHQRKHV